MAASSEARSAASTSAPTASERVSASRSDSRCTTARVSVCAACTSRSGSLSGSSEVYRPVTPTLKSSSAAVASGRTTRKANCPCTVTAWKSAVVSWKAKGTSRLASGTVEMTEAGAK
jgi:hypothetical protein